MSALVLLALLAVVTSGARELLTRAGEERASVALAAALASLAVLPELFGRAMDSIGFGALVLFVIASPWAFLDVRRRIRGPVFVERDARLLEVILAAAVLALGAHLAWTTFLWDEDSTHFPVASLVARGLLPPEQPYFPGEPFRYHIGYDVLVGIVRAVSGARIDVCCDVVTTLCLVSLLWILADAGRALAGQAGAALAVVLVLLGYGPLSACMAQGWLADVGHCDALLPPSWLGATTMPPAVISNFFQHPQGLGMPIAVAALLIGAERPSTSRIALAAALTALLAQANTVYFALTGLALGVAVVVDFVVALVNARKLDRARPHGALASLLARLALLAAAGVVGFSLGGVLKGGGAAAAIHFGRGYFNDAGVIALVMHNLALFGATVLAVPVAAVVALRRRPLSNPALRLALATAAAAGFVVANVASYERSWDIVKFFAAGAFFANLLLADLLAALWRFNGRARAASRVIAIVLALVSTSSATFWLLRHSVLNGVIAPVYAEQPPDAVGTVLDWLHGKDIPRDARVLTTHDDIAQLGFLVVGRDWRKGSGYLLDRAKVERDHAVRLRVFPKLFENDLDELRVSFVFVTEREARTAPALEDAARFRRVEGDVIVKGVHWLLYERVGVSD